MRPMVVLASALVRPASVLTAVCSSRRWLGIRSAEYSPASGWSLGRTALAKTITPEGRGGGGVHVPHATGQVVRAIK